MLHDAMVGSTDWSALVASVGSSLSSTFTAASLLFCSSTSTFTSPSSILIWLTGEGGRFSWGGARRWVCILGSKYVPFVLNLLTIILAVESLILSLLEAFPMEYDFSMTKKMSFFRFWVRRAPYAETNLCVSPALPRGAYAILSHFQKYNNLN